MPHLRRGARLEEPKSKLARYMYRLNKAGASIMWILNKKDLREVKERAISETTKAARFGASGL